MTIHVVNKKDRPELIYTDLEYVGRPSPLGNPFRIGEDGTREEVIEKYRQWIGKQTSSSEAAAEICRLANKYLQTRSLTLVCWCAPEACHADVIKDYIHQMILTESN